jgi:hypothetical protein
MSAPLWLPRAATVVAASVLLALGASVVAQSASAATPAQATLPTLGASTTDELTAFLAAVEREVGRFERVEAAIAEGYRKLGPDFPGMGEHWIHPGLVISGTPDPARPPVIAYTRFGAERRLVGVAYTTVLGPEDEPPDGPFPPDSWHDHTGGVDEESLLLAGPASMHASEAGFRLAMVHVWIPARNPQGVLAQNNWALPFLRAGLDVPESVSSEAARALSLAGVGEAFYAQLLREGVGLQGEELRLAMEAFTSGSSSARAWLDRQQLASAESAGGTHRAAVAELEAVWARVWRDLDSALAGEARAKLSVLLR